MKKLHILLFYIFMIAILFSIKSLGILNKNNNKSTSTDTPSKFTGNIKDKLTEIDLQKYYDSYKDPYVKHIRVALNGYLDGSNKGIEVPKLVIDKSEVNGAKAGLDSFSKDYYKSRFIIYSLNESIAGGKEINIIFQDKPDKIFYVWVYQLSSGDYDLRGFAENNKFTSKDIGIILNDNKSLIEDPIHSL